MDNVQLINQEMHKTSGNTDANSGETANGNSSGSPRGLGHPTAFFKMLVSVAVFSTQQNATSIATITFDKKKT